MCRNIKIVNLFIYTIILSLFLMIFSIKTANARSSDVGLAYDYIDGYFFNDCGCTLSEGYDENCYNSEMNDDYDKSSLDDINLSIFDNISNKSIKNIGDLNKRFIGGMTYLMKAAYEGNIDIAKILINNKVNLNLQNGVFYIHADHYSNNCSDKDPNDYAMDIMMENNPNMLIRGSKTALMLAAINGSYDMVKLLLDAGADKNIQDQVGHDALYYAIIGALYDKKDLEFGDGFYNYSTQGGYSKCIHEHYEETVADDACVTKVQSNYYDMINLLIKPSDFSRYLSLAIAFDNKKLIKYLINKGARVDNASMLYPLAESNDNASIDLIFNKGLNLKNKNILKEVFIYAVIYKNIYLLQKLLDLNIDVNYGYKITPLMYALASDYSCVEEYNLDAHDAGEDDYNYCWDSPNLKDQNNDSVTDQEKYDLIDKVFKLLITKDIDFSVVSSDGKTLMDYAKNSIIKDAVEILQKRGGNDFSNDLVKATIDDNITIVQQDISKGFNIKESIKNNELLLIRNLVEKKSINITKLLLDNGLNPNFQIDGISFLSYAIQKNANDIVKLLIARGISISDIDQHGYTPLYYAISQNSLDIVKLLLDKGANVLVTDKKGDSPLYYAIFNKSTGIVKLLLDHGANVLVTDKKGDSPLYYAIFNKSTGIVKLLLDHGADVLSKSKTGYTVLDYGIKSGSADIVKLLLDKGAIVSGKDIDNYTPLSYASKNNFNDIIKLLLDKVNDISDKDKNGYTPLDYAIDNNNKIAVKLLLDKNANIIYKNKDGNAPLFAAIIKDELSIVRLLIDHGANIEDKGINNYSPLIIATQYYNIEIVNELLKHHPIIDAKDDFGWTALMYAVDQRNINLVNLLLKSGAKKDIENKNGETALDIAKKHKIKEMIELLSM